MATQIKPGIVKQLRDERGWTQEELAKKAGLNKQSIFRIEKGEYRGTRHETIALLCKALEVDVTTLTGRPSNPLRPEENSADPFGTASQINLRIDNAARNALALTARRYGVQLSEIVEIAPFLFFLAAERSLQRRRERLNEVSDAIAEVEELKRKYRYLPIDMPANDDPICCEERSIQQNDIFGRRYEIETNRRSFRYAHDFDDNNDNPFAAFLKEELQNLKARPATEHDKAIGGTFMGWHPDVWSTPGYKICSNEAVDIVGNDKEAVRAILSGSAPLHEIPKELKNSLPEQLAEWAKSKAKENEIQLMDRV